MKPPRAAELLLLAMAGSPEAEFVAGDLSEEFGLIFARHGGGPARRWYARQVVRSAPALLALRIRSGDLTAVVLRAALGVLLPLVALDQLWRFVYSQIPLKDGVERAPAMLAANILLVALGSWMSAGAARRPARGAADAVAAMAAAALAAGTAVGAAPAAYVAGLLLVAPANSLLAMWRRRLR